MPGGHGHPERETQYVEALLRRIVELEQSWNLFQVSFHSVKSSSSGSGYKVGTSPDFVPRQHPVQELPVGEASVLLPLSVIEDDSEAGESDDVEND